MNVEIGAGAAKFPEKELRRRILDGVGVSIVNKDEGEFPLPIKMQMQFFLPIRMKVDSRLPVKINEEFHLPIRMKVNIKEKFALPSGGWQIFLCYH
jgi:hypothetical protein